MNLDLRNRTFIVTGGTDGLGLATAKALLGEGASVLVTGLGAGRSAELREAAGDMERRVAVLHGDNADPTLPEQLKRLAFQRWGRLDGLFVSVGGPPSGAVLTTSDDAWRQAFESVFLGTVRLVRELSASVADGGAIALMLATSAKEAALDIPISNGLRPGLAMLVKSFAAELGPRNIRVNSLLGNMIATDRIKEVLGDRAPPVNDLALRRMGRPEELGRMAAILLSPAASFLTGAAIQIDGGTLKSI